MDHRREQARPFPLVKVLPPHLLLYQYGMLVHCLHFCLKASYTGGSQRASNQFLSVTAVFRALLLCGMRSLKVMELDAKDSISLTTSSVKIMPATVAYNATASGIMQEYSRRTAGNDQGNK